MPTSELIDDNCELPRLIEETPEEKVEREQREVKRKSFVDQLKELTTPKQP
jgi:hypothetical protein